MMYEKASLFQDLDSIEKILKVTNPSQIKNVQWVTRYGELDFHRRCGCTGSHEDLFSDSCRYEFFVPEQRYKQRGAISSQG